MADTVRTRSQLLTALFQDGQTAGISAQDIRDLVVSILGCYGGMSLYNESGQAHSLDGSIGTSFVKVDTFDTDDPAYGVTPDAATDQDITIGANGGGVYSVDFDIAFLGSASTLYTFELHVNGSEASIGSSSGNGTPATVVRCGFRGSVTLAAGDVITVHVKCDGTSKDLTAYQCNLGIRRMA